MAKKRRQRPVTVGGPQSNAPAQVEGPGSHFGVPAPKPQLTPAQKEARARRRRARRFKPFDPNVRPPAGSYDPAIDAEDDSSRRGFEYLQQDTALAGQRARDDYTIGTEEINRRYQRLGEDQTQAARNAGVDLGGWAAQAIRKRLAAQQLDQGRLDLDYTRGVQDRETTLSRGGTEREAYRQGAQTARVFQAQQSIGYQAPVRPKNEFSNPQTGQVYQLRRTASGKLVKVLPSGRIVKRSNTTTLK